MLSPDNLHKILHYWPLTGVLTWKLRDASQFRGGLFTADKAARAWNNRFAGKPAFVRIRDGYRAGTIDGTFTNAHRVIWAMCTGEWPTHQIDHINHDRLDNRFENLRAVTRAENQKNLSPRRGVKTTGVRWDGKIKLWRAYIGVNHKLINIGTFQSEEAAIQARRAAEIEYGFHANHGKPA